MEHDEVHVRRITPEQACGLPGDERVRGAVKAVPPDPVLLQPLVGNRIRVSLRSEGLVEGRVEHRHLRQVGEEPASHPHALEVGRVVERGQRHEFGDLRDQLVVDEDRVGEPRSAVHDSVAHGNDVEIVEGRALRLEGVDRRLQRVLVGRDRQRSTGLAVRAAVHLVALRLTDALDETDRGSLPGRGVDQAVLQGRGSCVDHQHVIAHRWVLPALIAAVADSCCAWMAVIATVLMMSRTVAPRERSFTGFCRPCSTGPTATALADRCTAL